MRVQYRVKTTKTALFSKLEENQVFNSLVKSRAKDRKLCYSPKAYYTGYIAHSMLSPLLHYELLMIFINVHVLIVYQVL